MKIELVLTSMTIISLACVAPARAADQAGTADEATKVVNDGRNYKSAFEASEWCGVCEYRSYEEKENISYDNPPVAYYYWKECFKGPPIGGSFYLKYDFRERPTDAMPPGWKFSPDKMPKIGSMWIIFVPQCMPAYHSGFVTYHGAYGRQEATEENLAKVKAIIEIHRLSQQIPSRSFVDEAQPAQPQETPASVAQTYALHEDLLKRYIDQGNSAEAEAEYKWLLAARPSNALLHYNYAVLLKTSGKKVPAAVEYEKACMYDGSNTDYVGQCGQMLMYIGNYSKAYQYLGKAMQMPGGDKYKDSLDACKKNLIELDPRRGLNSDKRILYDALPPRNKVPGPPNQKDGDDN